MNKIEIKIPAGLTHAEELAAIAKQLNQKKLSGNAANKDIELIGDSVEIEHMQTKIIVTRISKEPVITMQKCNCCGREYQSNFAVPYWHNYGGKAKKVNTCSRECAESVVSLLGDRASITKSKLKAFVNFNR